MFTGGTTLRKGSGNDSETQQEDPRDPGPGSAPSSLWGGLCSTPFERIGVYVKDEMGGRRSDSVFFIQVLVWILWSILYFLSRAMCLSYSFFPRTTKSPLRPFFSHQVHALGLSALGCFHGCVLCVA